MLTDTTISDLIAKLGRIEPVPGVGGGDTGYRPLDEGEVAAATLVACGDAAIPKLIKATKSDDWGVRYRCADVLGILGSEMGLPTLVGLLSDVNWHVQQSVMLALLGDAGMDLAASGCLADLSAFMETCHRSARFDILRLLERHGTAEVRKRADRLLKQGSPARQTIVDAALSYAEKKQRLEALQVSKRGIQSHCDDIQREGTEQERTVARQFHQHWKVATEGLIGASAPPSTPVDQLLIPAESIPSVTPVEQLVLPVERNPESGAAPVVSSAPKPAWYSRLLSIADAVAARFQGAPPPSAPKSAPLLEVPAPSLEAYATRTLARRWLSPVAGMEMILIPAGAFLMGDKDQSDNPRRTVSLDAYWISRHPVTVKQYRTFCSETGHAFPQAPSWGWKEHHPIVNVSWNDAQAFCDWAGMKLPTEAEWEKAARGTEGRQYPWGDAWDGSKCANSVSPNELSSTMPVGSFPSGASPYGLLDMAGNVWEWCSDWYDANYHKTSPDRNPSGPGAGSCRVLRGGSWDDFNARFFRCAFRFRIAPVNWSDFGGFRCVVRSDTR